MSLKAETIFDHNPTKNELMAVVEINGDIDLAGYRALLKQRAGWRKCPVEYLAICHLQQLFSDRKDDIGFKKYTKILDGKFAEFRSKFFNE